MRTSLKYEVERRTKIDFKTGKEVSEIKWRGFSFFVSGAKSEKEHVEVINDFEDFLLKQGYSCDGFGDSSWEECQRLNDTKSFMYLSITVEDMDSKQDIEEIYKDWKQLRKEN